MKETIVKCKCDYCKNEMYEYEYDTSVKITIMVEVPNQNGGAGECNSISMSICNKCAVELGIINSEIHNGQMGERQRIKTIIEKSKLKIIGMFQFTPNERRANDQ